MTYTTFGHTFNTINEMKAFATKHGITVIGNKTYKETWFNAIETYMEVQSEVIAAAVDAKNAAIENATQSVAVADVAETAAVIVVEKAVEILTSPEAIAVYKGVLRVTVVSVAFMVMMAWTIGKWCWAHRDQTAVYHWVMDALGSRFAQRIKSEAIVVRWLMAGWVEAVARECDRYAQRVRAWVAMAVAWVGLGSAIVEVQ
jgi:hypothetical protein